MKEMKQTSTALPYVSPAKKPKAMSINKKKLIICRGIQGSGKSTWAKEWVSEDPAKRVRFNNDEIRTMLGGGPKGYWVPSREDLVDNLKKEFLWDAMSRNYDIVMDNMNLSKQEIEFLERTVDRFNNPEPFEVRPAVFNLPYEIEYKDFFIPLEECIARDAKRENPIGEKVIRTTYEKYKNILEG